MLNKYNPDVHHRRSIRLKGYDYSKAGVYFVTVCCHEKECHFGKIDLNKNEGMKSLPVMEYSKYGRIAYDEWLKLPSRFPNVQLNVFQIMPNHMHGIILLIDPPVGAGFTPALTNEGTIGTPDPPVGAGFTPALTNEGSIDTPDPPVGLGFTPARDTQDQTRIPTDSHVGVGFTPALDTQDQTDTPSDPILGARFIPALTTTSQKIALGNIIGAYKSLVANASLEHYKMTCESPDEYMGKIWQRNFYEHIIRNEEAYEKISDYIISNPINWETDQFYKA